MTCCGTCALEIASRAAISSSSVSLSASHELSRALAFLAEMPTTPERSILGAGASSAELDSELVSSSLSPSSADSVAVCFCGCRFLSFLAKATTAVSRLGLPSAVNLVPGGGG